MELRHLRYAIAVADELHFNRAAQLLNISQPPLSFQIRKLEEEVGVKLFDRTKRHVELTPAGRVFVEQARQILDHVNRAVRMAARVAHGEVGTLVVSTVTAEKPIVVESLRVFCGEHSDVHVELRSLNTAAQVQGLHAGEIHAGFVVMPIEDPQFNIEVVVREPLAIAMPEHHRLAKATRISLRSIAREPSVLLPRALSPRYYDQVIALCRIAGMDLRIIHEVDNVYTALALIQAGLGVALYPTSASSSPRQRIVFRSLEGAVPLVEHALIYPREPRSPVLKAYVDVVKHLAASKYLRGSSPQSRSTLANKRAALL